MSRIDLAHAAASSPRCSMSRPVFRSTPLARGDPDERRRPRAPGRSCGRARRRSRCARGGRAPCERPVGPSSGRSSSDVLVDAVVVVEVVRAALVEPDAPRRCRGRGRRCRSVHLLSPGRSSGFQAPGLPRAVEDEVQLGVVADPAPDGAAADLPVVRRPGRDAQVLALVLLVERLEPRADQAVGVGAGAVGRPGDLARLGVERREPARARRTRRRCCRRGPCPSRPGAPSSSSRRC